MRLIIHNVDDSKIEDNIRKLLAVLASYDFDLAKVPFDGTDGHGEIAPIQLFDVVNVCRGLRDPAHFSRNPDHVHEDRSLHDDRLVQLDTAIVLEREHELLSDICEDDAFDVYPECLTVQMLLQTFASHLLYYRFGDWEHGYHGEISIQPKAARLSIDIHRRPERRRVVYNCKAKTLQSRPTQK